MTNKTAYPLHWPETWGRTKSPAKSQFKTTLAGALANVQKSIEMFAKDSKKAVGDVLISSNVTLGDLRPKDSGVAVYFQWDGISTCIAVDCYLKVEENLQAIHHCIEAERTKLRHGGLNLVRAAFRGYAALPPGTGKTKGARSWWDVLGVPKLASEEDVKKAYKKLRSVHHEDKGGDREKFNEIQKAWEQYNAQA